LRNRRPTSCETPAGHPQQSSRALQRRRLHPGGRGSAPPDTARPLQHAKAQAEVGAHGRGVAAAVRRTRDASRVPVERLTPVFIDAPPLERMGPPAEGTLWRYIDLARFLALVERRALFFSSIRHSADLFEAALIPGPARPTLGGGEDRVSTARHWNLASS
jgi:hypothetical protein